MGTVLGTLWAIAFFLVLTILAKRRLFDDNGMPRKEARDFLVRNQSLLHPNLVSGYGLLLAGISMLLYCLEFFSLAVFIYVAAAYFDTLDGAIARASGLQTSVGEELDPLIDKLKTLPPILYFAIFDCFAVWFAISFVCLDVAGQLLRSLIHLLNGRWGTQFLVAANKFGKMKTTCAYLLVVYCDLQLRVDFVPAIAPYGLGIVMFLGMLSILFKFKNQFLPLRYLYGLIAK